MFDRCAWIIELLKQRDGVKFETLISALNRECHSSMAGNSDGDYHIACSQAITRLVDDQLVTIDPDTDRVWLLTKALKA